MALTIEIQTQDIVAATEWKTFSYTESIGQPDSLSVEAIGFTTDPIFTQPVTTLFATSEGYFYILAKLGNAILFSGLVRTIDTAKDAPGQMRYSLSAVGWEFLAPKRLVGRPEGDQFLIQGDNDPERLPTAVAVDPDGENLSPTVASVQGLWTAYWNSPWPLDLTTFVSEIVPVPGSADESSFSGTDIAGVMGDLCAAGSAAAMWWLANDSPDAQQALAPYLALHFGLVSLPDPTDDGDDLLMGFASADPPSPANQAPYAISDTPDWTTSILPVSMKFKIDDTQRVDATYVRGATGFTQSIRKAPAGNPLPYVLDQVVEGGTGWVGSPGGLWGEEHSDAPAAITPDQRDAYGSAFLASRSGARWSGTIIVRSVNPLGAGGYDGWHKGQAVSVTDADHGFVGRWFLIRSVSMTTTDPFAQDNEYTLTVGDTLSASLGYALRQQRLKEQRQEIAPATRFIPYVGKLLLDAGDTTPLTFQLANDAGRAMAVAGVGARWHLLLSGPSAGPDGTVDVVDVEDTGGAFYLSDIVEITDEKGQVTATGHAGTLDPADDLRPWVAMVP